MTAKVNARGHRGPRRRLESRHLYITRRSDPARAPTPAWLVLRTLIAAIRSHPAYPRMDAAAVLGVIDLVSAELEHRQTARDGV